MFVLGSACEQLTGNKTRSYYILIEIALNIVHNKMINTSRNIYTVTLKMTTVELKSLIILGNAL